MENLSPAECATNPTASQLLPLTRDAGRPAISARALHRFLEHRPGDFARWTDNHIVGNPYASHGEDWEVLRTDAENPLGGRPSQDYALALPFAKKLAMMSKSVRGEQAREYFLECERRAWANAPSTPDLNDPLVVARQLQDATALYIEAETARREAAHQLEVQAPAVAFARKVEFSPVDINIGTFAKAIGWKPNKLHAELRRRGFMFHRAGHPVPKQRYVDAGLFLVKEVLKGALVFPVTTITGKGQLRIARELGVSVQSALGLVP